MRNIILIVIVALGGLTTKAQLYIGSEAITIASGGIFHYDGLTLTPSADLTLVSTILTKTDANTISPTPSGTYIKRYYSFSNTTPAFTGTIRFAYLGADLNGLTAGDLQLNVRTSSVWTVGSGVDVGIGDSYVEATSFNSTGLNTLTLASSSSPLPVTWLLFAGNKKEHSTVLNWATATEQNTQDFVVQHSSMGSGWEKIGTVKAAGNGTTRTDYTFTHHAPVSGYNYYRLIQRDWDGKNSYSKIVSVLFGSSEIKTRVYPIPIIDGKLNVVLPVSMLVRLYDASGRQISAQQLPAGSQVIDVNRLQAGFYYLQVGKETHSIIIK